MVSLLMPYRRSRIPLTNSAISISEEGQLPWVQVQSFATQLEVSYLSSVISALRLMILFTTFQAFAMLDLATAQFRDKSSEAHKKSAGVTRELIATTLVAARKALAASAAEAKKMAAEEKWCSIPADVMAKAEESGHLNVSDSPAIVIWHGDSSIPSTPGAAATDAQCDLGQPKDGIRGIEQRIDEEKQGVNETVPPVLDVFYIQALHCIIIYGVCFSSHQSIRLRSHHANIFE
jgi:hypothetical protein